ncbi:MAG: hypothetical protein Q9220_004688 [cf. Caloplaca sp. 1 TL-2023]
MDMKSGNAMYLFKSYAEPETPSPTLTKYLAPRATTCNADNCYRAAKSLNDYGAPYANSLNELCQSYTNPSTIVTTLTSSPVILPSSCSAPGITSVCDCLKPAAPCATRAAAQRVVNPSFEDPNDGGWWSITDTARNYIYHNSNEESYDGSKGYTIWADGDSGVFTISQKVDLCPGSKYAFSAYIGYIFFCCPSTGPFFNSNVTVFFDDQVIVPTQLSCNSAAQCNKKFINDTGLFTAGYRQLTAAAPLTATSAFQTLKIVISRDSGKFELGVPETLLDLVTMTKVSQV